MGQKNDSLIAYNIFEKRIINSGFCTQCGACEACLSSGRITYEDEKVSTLLIAQKKWICALFAKKSAPIQKPSCSEA